MILEIAIESVDEALAAARGGADRLELCSALHLDGLTPSWDALVAIKRVMNLPVMVMIRPRAGGSRYAADEVELMEAQIVAALAHGADGLVFGSLHGDGAVDVKNCRRLIARCAARPAVFHRAFDQAPDPITALDQVIDLGFARVLTSGRQADASSPQAAALIARLIAQAAGRIEIMPGGGVRPHNAAALIRATGCEQVHSSCRAAGAYRVEEELVADLRRVIDQDPSHEGANYASPGRSRGETAKQYESSPERAN